MQVIYVVFFKKIGFLLFAAVMLAWIKHTYGIEIGVILLRVSRQC